MTLASVWFVLIATLWTGFFVLEGFDLGVGMLHGFLGKEEAGRRRVLETVGPLWDGNEVWLIVAVASMFAAFPDWYATLFSSFYLPLVVVLIGLIVRGVAFEFRGRGETDRWRRTWDRLMVAGSLVVPLLLGVALGDLLHGLPINAQYEFTGSLLDVFPAFSLYFGATLLLLCLAHGSTFVAVKTSGEIRARAVAAGRVLLPLAAVVALVAACWTNSTSGDSWWPTPLGVVAVLALVGAALEQARGHDGRSFVGTSVAIAATVLSIFSELHPRVLVSTTSPANDLTVEATASGSYTLTLITVIAAVLLPVVIACQAWAYHTFGRRMT